MSAPESGKAQDLGIALLESEKLFVRSLGQPQDLEVQGRISGIESSGFDVQPVTTGTAQNSVLKAFQEPHVDKENIRNFRGNWTKRRRQALAAPDINDGIGHMISRGRVPFGALT